MIELGKWYKYHGDVSGGWDILPLSIHDDNVFSIDVEIDTKGVDDKDSGPNIRLDTDEVLWFTEQMGDTLTLSTDPPSFSNIPLSYDQKATIFNTIFRSKG